MSQAPATGAPGTTGGRAPLRLALVVPCFNEEEVLATTIARLDAVLGELVRDGLVSPDSTLHFVDDGSRDGTWRLVEEAARAHPAVHGIKLSRNRGHQHALLAGLLEVDADAIISLDADLQDDLGAIREMVTRHAEGAEIVFGVRAARTTDTALKRLTAETYYRLLRVFGVEIVFNHADYRLLGRRALEALREFSEVNLFLRGVVPQLGFRTACVFYDRAERFAGESKYPLRKMLALAWDGVTSFSVIPLRWITFAGLLVSLGSFVVGGWALFVRIFEDSVPGWASTVIPMTFLGGVQLLSLGVIGEYIGKIYAESKRRPRYIVEKTV